MTKATEDKPATEAKALNQVQVKNLKDIANGDFDDLLAKVIGQLKARFQEKKKEIDEKYKDFDVEATKEELTQLKRTLEDTFQDKVRSLKEDGYEFRGSRLPYAININVGDLYHDGYQREMSQLQDAHSRLVDSARAIIARERRATERTILLQSITSDAGMEILRDLPDPDDVLPLVAAEVMVESDEDDVKLLIGDMSKNELQEGDA